MLKLILRVLLMLMLISSVYGCGDETTLVTGEESADDGDDDGGGSGDGDDEEEEPETDDDGGGGATVEKTEVLMGYIDSTGEFHGNEIGVGLASGGTLDAGSSTSLTVVFYDSETNTVLSQVAATVYFSSNCAAGSTYAEIESPVTAESGQAQTTYLNKGCSLGDGVDTVTATATVASTDALTGGTFIATANVNVADADVGSIEFLGASRQNIAIRGAGGVGKSETSVVSFKVLNTAGGVVPNATVNFTLSSIAGGAGVLSDSAVTDDAGEVSTVVRSGFVPGPIAVIASVDVDTDDDGDTDVVYSIPSSVLKVVGGLPAQDAFTVGPELYNPEAWAVDGVPDAVTVRMGDAYRNMVLPGTPVSFTTEGGLVVGACITGTLPEGDSDALADTDGSCTLNWISNRPRPANGRATIIAWAPGQEAFEDPNANGLYDAGESFTDLSEPYVDANENGAWDAGEKYFDNPALSDGVPNGVFDAGDGVFTGLHCSSNDETVCNKRMTLVWGSNLIVMAGSPSGSTYEFATADGTDVSDGIDINPTDAVERTDGCGAGSCYVSFNVSDLNGNTLPYETVISIAAGKGLEVEAEDCEVGNNYRSTADGFWPNACGFTVSIPDDEPGSNYVTVKVTTKGGVISVFQLWVDINND